MEMPHKLSHFNLFIDGKGFAGKVNELVLPKISMKTEDHLSGGMDVAVPVEMGMEPLQAEYTLASYEPEVFRLMGFRSGGPIALIARGSLKRDEDVIPVTVTVTGVVTEVDMGTWKKGDDTSLKFTVKCNYYRLDRGLENLIEIDAKNMIRKIGNVDQLAKVRSALLL